MFLNITSPVHRSGATVISLALANLISREKKCLYLDLSTGDIKQLLNIESPKGLDNILIESDKFVSLQLIEKNIYKDYSFDILFGSSLNSVEYLTENLYITIDILKKLESSYDVIIVDSYFDYYLELKNYINFKSLVVVEQDIISLKKVKDFGIQDNHFLVNKFKSEILPSKKHLKQVLPNIDFFYFDEEISNCYNKLSIGEFFDDVKLSDSESYTNICKALEIPLNGIQREKKSNIQKLVFWR